MSSVLAFFLNKGRNERGGRVIGVNLILIILQSSGVKLGQFGLDSLIELNICAVERLLEPTVDTFSVGL